LHSKECTDFDYLIDPNLAVLAALSGELALRGVSDSFHPTRRITDKNSSYVSNYVWA